MTIHTVDQRFLPFGRFQGTTTTTCTTVWSDNSEDVTRGLLLFSKDLPNLPVESMLSLLVAMHVRHVEILPSVIALWSGKDQAWKTMMGDTPQIKCDITSREVLIYRLRTLWAALNEQHLSDRCRS